MKNLNKKLLSFMFLISISIFIPSGVKAQTGEEAEILTEGTPEIELISEEVGVTPKVLKVVTKTVEPFVMKDSDDGFSVDLWNVIAAKMGVEFEFYRKKSVSDLIGDVESGTADLSIAAITTNSEREKIVDFTHSIYDSGLGILISTEHGSKGIGLDIILDLLKVLGVLLIAIFIAGNVIWIFERKHNEDFNKKYLSGMLDGFWWSAVTVTTVGYGDKAPKTFVGRVIGIVWMFASLFLVAYFTSAITSTLTIQSLQSSINGPSDLVSKKVATLENTTSHKTLKGMRIKPILYTDVDDIYADLKEGKIDAFVYDYPILQYYAATEGGGKVKIAGSVFNQEFYGIAVPKGSSLRDDINVVLLGMKESGEYKEIYEKWFGKE